MKKEETFLLILILFFTFNAFSQTVVKTEEDRTGSRFANKWWVRTDDTKQIWRTGKLNSATRKAYVRAGKTDLLVGLGPTPSSINQMINGSRVSGWTTLKAGKAKDFGNPSELVIISTGSGKFYVHVEWKRKRGSIFGW